MEATQSPLGFAHGNVDISLRDWNGARVLARPPGHDCYLPGSIKLICGNADVGVHFDNCAADQPPVFFQVIRWRGQNAQWIYLYIHRN